ncbi:WXG100 family type VII secretion target [Streptomyces griseus]|uniref:WXG100 family type VII secretion target n=1 Tax=Streptomyces griseus TaxID=1911 RepID=UPI003433A57B
MSTGADLHFTEGHLTALADDMEKMRLYLDRQVRRMDGIVDEIEAGWQGKTGDAYRALHRGAAQDAVRIRGILAVLEEAVRMSRDGFTAQELDLLRDFRQVQSAVDVAAEAEKLQAEPDPAIPSTPHSRINDL